MGTIALALAAALSPEGAELLQPSTGWNIDYAENSCTLSRSFGTGEDAVSLGFIPQTGGPRMRIVLISKDSKRFTNTGNAQITMGESPPVGAPYYSLIDPKLGRVALIRTMRPTLAPLGNAKTLTLDLGGRAIGFSVPQMAGALKALETCETDLIKGWGFDFSLIEKHPQAIDANKWFKDAYPEVALQRENAGESGVRVSVDITGKPVACAVTEPSGSLMLDTKACDVIMKRGQFKPAIGKDGKPIAGLWVAPVLWTLPGSLFGS